MTEFEYLKKLYWRLHEFEAFLARDKRENPKKKDFVHESAVCAIKCTIEDYLALRKEAK